MKYQEQENVTCAAVHKLYLLIEASILICWVLEKKKNRERWPALNEYKHEEKLSSLANVNRYLWNQRPVGKKLSVGLEQAQARAVLQVEPAASKGDKTS